MDERHRTHSLLAFLLILCWLPVAFSQTRSTSATVERAFLELIVNGVDKGEVLVVLQSPEILVPVGDLTKAGLRSVGGSRRRIAGENYVPLSSLAPAVRYLFDKKELALRLTVDPRLLGTTTLRMRTIQPEGMIHRSSPSGFMNYAFNAEDFSRFSAFTEGGLSLDGKLFYSGLSLTPGGQWVRGLTNLTLDAPGRMRRLVVGDTFADTGLLGSGVFLEGASVSRDFALNPYFIPYPMPQLTGLVTLPSQAEVYVNGTLVKQLQLPPGRFNLQDLPFVAGAGNTQVVLRNIFGQQQVISAPYYMSTQVLKKGLNEYTYNLGVIRSGLGTASWQHGPLALAAHHLYGLTDWLTLGGFFEADHRVGAGGPQLALRLPIGQLGLWGALSGGQATGWSTAMTYSYLAPRYSFGGDLTLTSRRYATLSLTPALDRPLAQADAFVGIQRGRLSLFPSVRYSDFRDAGRRYAANLIGNIRLSSRVNLQLSAGRSQTQGKGPATDFSIGLNFSLGRSTVGTLSYDHLSGQPGGGSLATVQLQKSLPLGVGYGYLLQGQAGPQNRQIADFQYQGPYGEYELDYSRLLGRNSTHLNLSGGLAGIGGHLYATRPVEDSYALIRVPGVKGVTGYDSNQSMGRTNSHGDLFMPNLLSNYGNDLSINTQNIPMDYAVEATRRIVATPYRGGAVVTFPVHRLQAFIGRLEVRSAGKTVIPAYGELTVRIQSKKFSSPLGRHGEFYFESLPVGGWPAVVDYQGGECKFNFTVPSSKERFVRMGIVPCVMR